MGRHSRTVPATAEQVWAALTDPAALRHWSGALDTPLREGKLSRLDLGDGDVWVLEVVSTEPPHRLTYRRRLFGIDTKETVGWRIAAGDGGCLVTVEWSAADPGDDRPDGEYEQWRGDLDRLERFLAGEPVPPRARDREFLLGTELPGEPAAVRDQFEEFVAAQHPPWPAAPGIRITAFARGQGTKLVVRHRGWAGAERGPAAAVWHRLLLRFTLAYSRTWQIPTLSAASLSARLDGPEDLILLDANRETLWERGHLPRAVFVGQEDLPLDRLPADPAAKLVFYCRDSRCLTAYLSAAKARTLGYPNTYVMEGGRKAWVDAGLPLVPENAAGIIDLESADGE